MAPASTPPPPITTATSFSRENSPFWGMKKHGSRG
jgi:hypothetical protein